MQVQELISGARDVVSVKRVYGDPYEQNGLTVIPAATVRGGGGVGMGDDEPRRGGQGRRLRDDRAAERCMDHRGRARELAARDRREPGHPRRPGGRADRDRRHRARPARALATPSLAARAGLGPPVSQAAAAARPGDHPAPREVARRTIAGVVGIALLTLVPGELGGSETYARELLRALARGGELDYRVLLPPVAPGRRGRAAVRGRDRVPRGADAARSGSRR